MMTELEKAESRLERYLRMRMDLDVSLAAINEDIAITRKEIKSLKEAASLNPK